MDELFPSSMVELPPSSMAELSLSDPTPATRASHGGCPTARPRPVPGRTAVIRSPSSSTRPLGRAPRRLMPPKPTMTLPNVPEEMLARIPSEASPLSSHCPRSALRTAKRRRRSGRRVQRKEEARLHRADVHAGVPVAGVALVLAAMSSCLTYVESGSVLMRPGMYCCSALSSVADGEAAWLKITLLPSLTNARILRPCMQEMI